MNKILQYHPNLLLAFFIAVMPLPALATEGVSFEQRCTGGESAITPTAAGAHLRAVMQDLEAEVTDDGLWLTSTADEDAGMANRFRVRAVTAARTGSFGTGSGPGLLFAGTGRAAATKDAAVWVREEVIEEYTVSTDGVRQDFVLPAPPSGDAASAGDLVVELEVTGARAEIADYGAKLTVDATGRELAYSRLRVTDATGQALTARMESSSPNCLRVVVKDTGAAYPVRVDPTFSDADWVALNAQGLPGASAPVHALAMDGSGNLYIGGEFTGVGPISASRVAKWNGSTWSALGSGTGGTVSALAVMGNDLYAGGSFETAGGVTVNRIAKWNGSAWSALGTGMNSPVATLAVIGNHLYAGGGFVLVNGQSISRLARWDGATWTRVGQGVGYLRVSALTVSGSDLFIGGAVSSGDNYLSKWDGTALSTFGSGLAGDVNALAVSGGTVYAGGNITTAGGVTVNGVAKWDGNAWSALGSGMDAVVRALAMSGNTLYAGGAFATAGEVNAYRVARWDGNAWSALGSGALGNVNVLLASGSTLYAGGSFQSAGGAGAKYVARWDGAAWSGLGSGGIDNWVYALAVSGTDLYAGGVFVSAGGVTVNRIAKWNGSTWSPVGSGMDNTVYALEVDGNNLYAGGSFTTAGGVPASRVAKWNGSAWSALGTGMSSTVEALAVSGGVLYAGGGFTTAGGVSANRIAKWDGNAWSPLGTGMSSTVLVLEASGNTLYAGGAFTTAGDVPANRIAKWDGSTWSALGAGVNNSVFALAVSGSNVYAGGFFTQAGGAQALRVAKWDGNAWSPLGSGMPGTVLALEVVGSTLYAGGGFSSAGGVPAYSIAEWDGNAWSMPGSGMDGTVHALAADAGGHLFAGGEFIVAGTTYTPYIARASLTGTPAGFAAWQAANFTLPAEAAFAAPNADPDNDGVVNLIEYAVKSAPKGAGRAPGSLTFDGGGALQLVFEVRDDDPSLRAFAQSAASLSSFAGNIVPVITDPVPGDGLKRWTFTDQPPAGTNLKRYLRAVFTLN